ncbi:hypothetical protein [Mucilaginibacter aquatilis]|uniref:hypothetical protein n=1 Tax=Mucilaginibacter aquatilis TaxID=1517760 RepID=UPI0018DC1528|nr:hypothetical protein [Mucilaginibacter aquatilis]
MENKQYSLTEIAYLTGFSEQSGLLVAVAIGFTITGLAAVETWAGMGFTCFKQSVF